MISSSHTHAESASQADFIKQTGLTEDYNKSECVVSLVCCDVPSGRLYFAGCTAVHGFLSNTLCTACTLEMFTQYYCIYTLTFSTWSSSHIFGGEVVMLCVVKRFCMAGFIWHCHAASSWWNCNQSIWHAVCIVLWAVALLKLRHSKDAMSRLIAAVPPRTVQQCHTYIQLDLKSLMHILLVVLKPNMC